jgi:hypothetical protein
MFLTRLLPMMLILVIAMTPACATLPHRHHDLTSAQLQTLLTWAQDGLDIGCHDEWVPADVCAFGTSMLNIAQAIAAHHAPHTQAAVRLFLVNVESKTPADSTLRPYFDWLVGAL